MVLSQTALLSKSFHLCLCIGILMCGFLLCFQTSYAPRNMPMTMPQPSEEERRLMRSAAVGSFVTFVGYVAVLRLGTRLFRSLSKPLEPLLLVVALLQGPVSWLTCSLHLSTHNPKQHRPFCASPWASSRQKLAPVLSRPLVLRTAL